MFIPSHLLLSRHNVYYFRWAIPVFLHPQGRQSHIKLSLGTRDPREALRLSRHLAYHAEHINWHLAHGMDYSEIQQHLREHFAKMLAHHKGLLDKNGPMDVQGVAIMQNMHDFLKYAIETGQDDFIPTEKLEDELANFIRIRKLDIPKDSHAYELLKQDYKLPYLSYTRELLAYNSKLRNYDLASAPLDQAIAAPKAISVTLQRAVNEFIKERKRGEAWTARTLAKVP